MSTQQVPVSTPSDSLRRAARAAGVPPALLDQVTMAASSTLPSSGRGEGVSGAAGPVVVACDLDRTLIYSAAALTLGTSPSEPVRTVVVEHYQDAPWSFQTADAALLLDVLKRESVFVPCTTRTTAQYARVQLPGAASPYAVTVNGGRILLDGAPCPDWSRTVQDRLASSSAEPAQIDAHLDAVCDPAWALRRRSAEGLFTYLVVDRSALPRSFVDDLTGWCATQRWKVSLQGRKLYLLPEALTKSAAVAEVVTRAGASRVFAAGDSLLDVDLLESAELGIRPAHGELHDQAWNAPHVAVTTSSGVLAGQEVVAHLLAAVLTAAPTRA